MRFFFYGTLRDGAVRRLVLGRALPDDEAIPAVLEGYRIARVRGADYPVLRRDPTASAGGVVFGGLSHGEAERLDRYEGGQYLRRELTLRARTGEPMSAWVYLPRGRVPVDSRPWDFEGWLRDERAAFLHSIAGLRAAGR